MNILKIIINFINSPIGVSIAWILTVIGFIYGILKRKECNQLKLEVDKISNDYQQILDQSNNEVNQNGEKNIYNKNVSGGMKIEM